MNGKRKFLLAAFVVVVAATALFVSKMSEGGFITLATLVLGIYGTHNVVDKKLGGAG